MLTLRTSAVGFPGLLPGIRGLLLNALLLIPIMIVLVWTTEFLHEEQLWVWETISRTTGQLLRLLTPGEQTPPWAEYTLRVLLVLLSLTLFSGCVLVETYF